MYRDKIQIAPSFRHDRTNVCRSARIHRRDEICRKGGGGSEKRDRFGALLFYMPHAVESPHKIRQVTRFLVDCKSPWTTMGGRKRAV